MMHAVEYASKISDPSEGWAFLKKFKAGDMTAMEQVRVSMGALVHKVI
jgi:hypothetical protein